MVAVSKPSSQLARRTTPEAKSQRPKGREGAISALNLAIEAMDLAEKTSSITPVKAAFSLVSTLLTMIRVCLPLFCNDLLQAHLARTRWQMYRITSSSA